MTKITAKLTQTISLVFSFCWNINGEVTLQKLNNLTGKWTYEDNRVHKLFEGIYLLFLRIFNQV